jgi:hypothetical protein
MSAKLCTTQALKEWDSVLKLLLDLKAHAATHPNELIMPQHLAARFQRCAIATVNMVLASPADTWRQLLQQQVNAAACQQYWA